MKIHGIQKLTLLDFPGRTACTVFFGHCNFRCPFCHNASLVLHPESQPVLDEKEVLDYIRSRKGLLDGVAITGGEPTLQPDLLEFMGRIKAMDLEVKLDTNGWNPALLRDAVEYGFVDYVAMDIKSSPAEYPRVCGVPGFDLTGVKESVSFLMSSGADYEFRTTVIREFHTVPVMEEIGKWIRGADRYFLQGFKDSGDLLSSGCSGCSPAEMHALLDAVLPFVPSAQLRGVAE